MHPDGSSATAVAVVIPLFNGARWIEETIRSVLAQTHAVAEVVVVEDGSTDDGPARVRALGDRVRLITSTRKKRARHTGLLATRAPLVAFVDHDDLWHPEHVAGLQGVLAEHPETPAACSTLSVFRDGEEPAYDPRAEGLEAVDAWGAWPWSCPIRTPSCVLFRREPLEAAGGWAIDTAPDWEVYLRASLRAPILQRRAVTCGYRIHPAARSSELRRDGFAYLAIMQAGATHSLAHRRATEGDSETTRRLEARLPVLDRTEDLMRAIRAGRRRAAGRAALAIEDALCDVEPSRIREYFDSVFHWFCPDDAPGEHLRLREALHAQLEAVWPAESRRTRAVLVADRNPRPFRWTRLLRQVSTLRFRRAAKTWRRRWDVPTTATADDRATSCAGAPERR